MTNPHEPAGKICGVLPNFTKSRQFHFVASIVVIVLVLGLVHKNATIDPSGWRVTMYRPASGEAGKLGQQVGSTDASSWPKDEKLAYATWLSSTVADPEADHNDDVYFVATRMLVYQLLHAPQTRSRRSIPVVVLVTPDVSRAKCERLTRDGAIVRPVSLLQTGSDWIHPGDSRWRDVLSKLRVWELTEYSRIMLLDGDTVLQRSLDGVFDEPGAQITATYNNLTDLPAEHASFPSHYLLASTGELPDANHKYPPDWDDFKNPGQFCAGFFLLEPSLEIFKYYKSVLAEPGYFDGQFPEQGLLNYAHRWDGPMPWKEVSSTWNVRSVNSEDFRLGVASMHEKWWMSVFSGSKEVADWFIRVRWEMEGFYQCWDEFGGR